MKRILLLSILMWVANFCGVAQDKPKNTKVEQQTKICENLDRKDKPVVAVMPFKVAVNDAGLAVGQGLPDMLMNALLGSGCFRVVERDRLNDIMKEQGLGLSGAGDEKTFAQIGKVVGADVLVFGTITEFKENESGGGGGGLFRLPTPGIGAIGIGTKKAHVGYTLRFTDPNTGEVLDMKSFDKKKSSTGVAGGSIFGGGIGVGTFYKSQSMQDAIEESLIEAITYMSQNKSVYKGVMDDKKANEASAAPKMSKEECALLKLSRKPTFMVVIPEEHLTGAGSRYDPNTQRYQIYIDDNTSGSSGPNGGGGGGNDRSQVDGASGVIAARTFFRPPDPAGETEIAKRFLEYGFTLIDSKQFEKLRETPDFKNALEDPSAAQRIAKQFGADILVVGEAFSEFSRPQPGGMVTCRARVEVKAIMASNAQLLVTEGLYGSGLDISEVIAGKKALAQAGGKVADYFLVQLCTKATDIGPMLGSGGNAGGTTAGNATAVASGTTSELRFKNTDFNKAMAIGKMLQTIHGVTKVERTAFENGVARFAVQHTSTTDGLIEKIATAKSLIRLNVLNISGNTADIEVVN